jgi:hypothetical protein
MRIQPGRRTLMVGAVTTIAVALVALAVLGVVGIAGWEYTNSNAFCASVCHSVHPEESLAHPTSAHGRVNCVECHMGRSSTLHLMALKPTHLKELWGMIAGYERPTHGSTLRPAREACESCHFPQTRHRDSVSFIERYGVDPKSSKTEYRITLHTSADAPRDVPWTVTGIHWHVSSTVEFKSPDPQGEVIPWVQVTKKDGSKSTYVDSESKIPKGDVDKLEARRMECYNCHNSVGHPFANPAYKVDAAITAGRISRSLPSVKARAVAMIEAAYKVSGSRDERTAAIDKLIAENAAKYPVDAKLKEKDAAFRTAMRQILLDSTFEAKDVSWRTFPNHAQHADSPGCFRCHDGKHFNEKGESIRLQCTLCHDLPKVRLESGGETVPSVVSSDAFPPDSHFEPNFMHEHQSLDDEACTECHGKPDFGRDGGNFCANPACHGRAWPSVNLNATPPKTAAASPGAAAKDAPKDAAKAAPKEAAKDAAKAPAGDAKAPAKAGKS